MRGGRAWWAGISLPPDQWQAALLQAPVEASSACRVVGGLGDRRLMDPAEVEFLAEQQPVTIIPNFSLDRIYLIGVSRSRGAGGLVVGALPVR